MLLFGGIIVQQESWYRLWPDEGGPCVFYDRKYDDVTFGVYAMCAFIYVRVCVLMVRDEGGKICFD